MPEFQELWAQVWGTITRHGNPENLIEEDARAVLLDRLNTYATDGHKPSLHSPHEGSLKETK